MHLRRLKPYFIALFTSAAIPAMLVTTLASAEVKLDPIAPRLVKASPERGEKLFLQCRACHLAEPGGRYTVGPNLWGIIGREVAAEPDFPYSESLQAIGGTWDYEKLNRYLFDPGAIAPQTRMIFAGVKPATDRAYLIAYLRTLSDAPPAMPEVISDEAEDQYGGLPEGDGREAVYFTCRACHSLDQFISKKLPREDWDELLDQMVADNGMEAPMAWARDLMLSYLSTHYGKLPEEGKDWDGLPPGEGREEVYYSCNACHSLKLVTQQGMSRSRWDETLEWMVEEQGMNEIADAVTRTRILDYLVTHFGSG